MGSCRQTTRQFQYKPSINPLAHAQPASVLKGDLNSGFWLHGLLEKRVLIGCHLNLIYVNTRNLNRGKRVELRPFRLKPRAIPPRIYPIFCYVMPLRHYHSAKSIRPAFHNKLSFEIIFVFRVLAPLPLGHRKFSHIAPAKADDFAQ